MYRHYKAVHGIDSVVGLVWIYTVGVLKMPELPEVQTIVDDLKAAGLIGAVISRVSVHWPRTIATSTPRTFCRRMNQRAILGIHRRAKFILFQMDADLSLIVHLRMTGRFRLRDGNARRGKHDHVVISLRDQRRLFFHDTRKFGRFYLSADPQTILGKLGPEPLDSGFTARALAAMLNGRRRQIKPLLLDQTFISGLGNIYADEALWAARIHPQRRADTVAWNETKALHRSIRKVLRQALANSGTTLGRGQGNFFSLYRSQGNNANQLKVFRRTGEICHRCGATIKKIIVGQRSTHFCVRCQIGS